MGRSGRKPTLSELAIPVRHGMKPEYVPIWNAAYWKARHDGLDKGWAVMTADQAVDAQRRKDQGIRESSPYIENHYF